MKNNEQNRNIKSVKIDKTILESFNDSRGTESQTIIHCKLNACEMLQQGGWANISPTTYLINSHSNKKLKLVYAENIPYAPHRHLFRHSKDCLYFTLIFQKIPEAWTTFCLYEESKLGDGFFIAEIPINKNGVYRIRIN